MGIHSTLKEHDKEQMKDGWRFKMEKQFDDLKDLHIKRQEREVLEISSTGYGLESVLKETEKDSLSKEHKNGISSTYE